MACTSCDGSCYTGCGNGCGTACTNGCSSCSGCTNTCTSCSGTCTGDCSGCSGCSSCSSCSGCSGCSSCSGTCTGYCDTACTATNTAQIIADLGANILAKGFFRHNDFVELKVALRKEFTRRNKVLPTTDTYINEPANGVALYKEHLQKVLDDAKLFSSSNNLSVGIGNAVMTSDSASTIAYIQTLMSQNTKS